MPEDYVRESVFNDRMREMDKRISNLEGDIKAINTRLDNWEKLFTMAINSVNKRIDDLGSRFNDLQNSQGQKLALWGILTAIAVGAIQVAVALWIK